MADNPPISDLLQQVKTGDSDAVRQIVEHFWEGANRVITRRLSPSVRRLVAGSDIANAALRSALSHVADSGSTVASRDDFWRLLVTIIRRKAASAARYANADLRSAQRTVALPEHATAAKEGVLDHLIAEEFGERAAALLLAEPDEQLQLVAVLGINDEQSPGQIREALAAAFPQSKPPAIRTIQAWLKESKERLASELFKDDEDE